MAMYIAFKLKRALAVLMIVCIAAAAVIAGARFEDSFTAEAGSVEGIKLPVVMYHSLLKDPGLQGRYVISPDLFEEDLQYLRRNGYTAVGIEDLLRYVDGKASLPEKPILLTFDDGYYNNYYYAFPLAKQYGMKIVISPVGSYMDKAAEENDPHPTYSYITWEDMREMAQSGLVEFQNHTYDLQMCIRDRKRAHAVPHHTIGNIGVFLPHVFIELMQIRENSLHPQRAEIAVSAAGRNRFPMAQVVVYSYRIPVGSQKISEFHI